MCLSSKNAILYEPYIHKKKFILCKFEISSIKQNCIFWDNIAAFQSSVNLDIIIKKKSLDCRNSLPLKCVCGRILSFIVYVGKFNLILQPKFGLLLTFGTPFFKFRQQTPHREFPLNLQISATIESRKLKDKRNIKDVFFGKNE